MLEVRPQSLRLASSLTCFELIENLASIIHAVFLFYLIILGDGHEEDDSGRCFSGTYCAAGFSRTPYLELDSCPKGYYWYSYCSYLLITHIRAAPVPRSP